MASQKPQPQPKAASSPNQDQDLGFGTVLSRKAKRLINKDGSFNVRRTGASLRNVHLYHYLISTSWPRFWLIVFAFYLVFNGLFACLYLLAGVEHLSGHPASDHFLTDFSYAFFFSVQTFTTVGYGAMSPEGPPANLIASVEAMTGLIGFAFASGLLYGRFSRPTAYIHYSENALIAPYRGETNGFMFRIVNGRNNQLIRLNAQVIMTWFEGGNHEKRRFAQLQLEREQVTFFPTNWTIVHPIDDDSPLGKWDETDFRTCNPEFLIIISGYDDTFAQEVHSRHSYRGKEVVWGAKFEPMFELDEEGETILELDMLGTFRSAALNKKAAI